MDTNISIFRGKGIRKTINQNEWWFVIADVISALTDSVDPGGYLKDMRRRDPELFKGWGQIATPLSIQTDGGPQKLNCANTEGLFRIIQSISSPYAETIKRQLAKVGYERVREIEEPEWGTRRTRALYQAKGYSDDWIGKRIWAIAIREELTDEWKKREVRREAEHAILTAEIAKAAFGVAPDEHKQIKGLKRQNLRDHMTDLELIFSMLGEAATTEITRVDDAWGFRESKKAARKGGEVASRAREDLERKTRKKVVSPVNYLEITQEKQKRLKGKSG